MQDQIADIQQRRESLTKEVDFDCYDGIDAAGLKGSLRQDGFWAKHWPWSERNDARRKCRRFLRIPKPIATDCIRIIDQMTTLHKDESAIRDHHEARSFLGELYQGEDTKWEQAITACTVTRKLVDLFGMLRLDELLARPAPCATTELIETGLTTVQALKEVVDTHIQMHDYGFERMNRMRWTAVLPALEKATQDISGIIAWYDAIPWEPWRALPFGRIGQTLKTAKLAATLDAALPVHSSRSYLGKVFQGTSTNTEQIAAVCANLDTIAHCRDGAPASAHAAVLAHFAAGNWDDAFATLKSWQENTEADITALRRIATDLEDLHATTAGDPFHIESYAEPLPAWQHHISARCANADGLLTWHELSNRIIKAESLGYKPLIDPLLNAEIPVSLLTKAFEASSRKAYIDAFAAANGIDLNELREAKVNLRREAFRKADAQRLAVSTEMVIREHLGAEAPDEGPSGSRISDKRGMQLVKSAIGKKRTSVTVRDLTDRAGATLKAFKPVWLMSPGSTSQYLPQAPDQFDVLIVDEASQLRTAEIAGAALRSKRILIFGDTKQMPPSNQMRRSASNSNEDYELGESLLERAAMSMPSVRLEWHYRSQHEDLIAYSNRAFYDDSLVVFPSPTPEAPDLGVAYEFVGGHFVAKINQAEAQRAADLMCAYLTEQTAKAPDERHTVGVVAMNGNQRDLIAEMVDRKRTNDQRIHQALIASEDAEEPFFITNLENVQGDERDHIIISCTYGPVADGLPVRNNFGPITNVGGERRLNVLFTRARRRMTVLSSMHPGDIRTTGGGNPHLRDFLAFAGDPDRRLPARGHKGEGPENIFEEIVGRVLEEAGYTVDYQVGCKGYRIDMAVHDQDLPGSYLLAIECDGATYHSSKTARERDRMRQEILEYAGWRFHRVWSTDWFLERSKTSIKLLDALAEAQEEARNERALRQAAQEADAKERAKHAATQAAREEKAAHLVEADADFTDNPLLTATDTAQNVDDESDHCEVFAPDTTLIPNMAPYRRWVGTAGGSVDEPDVTPSTIAAALVRIVTIEGPMLSKVAFDRYRAGSSMGRLTARRLGFMEAGLTYATKHLGLVCDEVEEDDNGVLRMHNQPEVHLRAGGDRQICDIPNAETKAFVSQFIAARKGQASESKCLDAVLRWLHMTRRGARIVKAVQEALNERS